MSKGDALGQRSRIKAGKVCLFPLLMIAMTAPGCRDRGRVDEDNNHKPCVVVVTNVVTRHHYADYEQLVKDALAAMNFESDDVVKQPADPVMDPASPPDNTTRLLLLLDENTKLLQREIVRKREYELRLRNDDPEIKALYEIQEQTSREYEQLLADRLQNSIVVGRIAQYTRRLHQLSQQLQKLKETP